MSLASDQFKVRGRDTGVLFLISELPSYIVAILAYFSFT